MVESFMVDHTKLEAPSIRLAGRYEYNGVAVRKYDIRFTKPNVEFIEDSVMHSLEHLLATAFREVFGDYMIDISPMGCKTGFYFSVFEIGDTLFESIKIALKLAINIPVVEPTEKNCGNYKMHDFYKARKLLEGLIDGFNSCCDQ